MGCWSVHNFVPLWWIIMSFTISTAVRLKTAAAAVVDGHVVARFPWVSTILLTAGLNSGGVIIKSRESHKSI